jgi:hypothetical protein
VQLGGLGQLKNLVILGIELESLRLEIWCLSVRNICVVINKIMVKEYYQISKIHTMSPQERLVNVTKGNCE